MAYFNWNISDSDWLQVYCSLKEWQTGQHVALDFTDSKYQFIYQEFVDHLQEMRRTRSPGWIAVGLRCKEIARAGL